MSQDKRCSSCGVRISGNSSTVFPCPNCGNVEIGRCRNCRDQSVKYECSGCGFRGP